MQHDIIMYMEDIVYKYSAYGGWHLQFNTVCNVGGHL